MKQRNLTLSIVTAAALAAFGAVNAHDVTADSNAGVESNVGISNSDVNASGTISPDLSIGSSGATSPSSSDSTSSSSIESSGDMSASSGASASVDSSTDEERLKGLDRADQAAGVHGQGGRDNAREHQERN